MQSALPMLRDLQHLLETAYEIDTQYRVEDYLFTNDEFARALEGDHFRATPEKLLIREAEEGLDVSLYLEAALLERLCASSPLQQLSERNLADFWTVLEGLSHFVYLVYNAGFDRGVSRLELELQAEVDKFIASIILFARQNGGRVPAALHENLFKRSRLHAALGNDEARRYHDASRYAARFCRSLAGRFSQAGHSGLIREARRFYRLAHHGKLRFIERQKS